MWCNPCRAVGMIHCAHPDECGNMLSDEAAADNWKAWLDDLPLDAGFAKGIGQVQDFITGIFARAEAAETALAAERAKVAELTKDRPDIAEPHEPGGFVGDIYYGHPENSTLGTHRWTGSEWAKLPSDTEALMALLASARAEAATLRAEVERLRGALRRWELSGCPDCGGDCASANPPVSLCIMRETRAALEGKA